MDKIGLARGGQQGLGIGGGEVPGRNHQLGHLDLAHGLHLAQDLEGDRIDRPVLQKLDHLRRDPVQQIASPLDRAHVNIQRLRQLLLGTPRSSAHTIM